MEDYPSDYTPFLRQYGLVIGLAVLGLLCTGFGAYSFLSPKSSPADIIFEAHSTGEASSSASISPVKKDLIIDISGAVENPGVYHLESGDRIEQAIIAAGGLSISADAEQIAKKVNLASKVTDGMKLYIPKKGDTTVILGTSSSDESEASSTEVLDINTASSTQLDSLPGIGPVTSEKIIANRPYMTIEELKTKKAVTSGVFEKIKNKITVN